MILNQIKSKQFAGLWLTSLIALLLLFTSTGVMAQVANVKVVSDGSGIKLQVDGKDFMINGMNWDYIPIGTNTVNANFWKKSDADIRAGLDSEMSLLKNMNVNVIRQYTGVPAKWIQYIYENYGIYTMLNHSFGRYGLTLDGVWTPVTHYDEPRTQEYLMSEITELVKEYKDTPGLLLYLLGNENNYGLFWQGAETEDFPDDEAQKKFIGEKRGRPMYRLMNEASVKMKSIDSSHPVAICNGDVLFIDIIAEECKDVDIFGTNTYRGVSFGDMFQVVKDKLNKPIMFTEFGADAFNAIENAEDQESQAYYMVGNWKEIYENAAGLGKVGNSIGGFTFQFSDGWWKFGFDDRKNADVHDNNASWSNGGYQSDYKEGENNMNEEWFGICAKGSTNSRGLYQLYPRAAYYALKEAHSIDPYAKGMTADKIEKHFSSIQLMDAVLQARGDRAALIGEQNSKIRVSGLRAEFYTFNTGGDRISTPDDPVVGETGYPNALGFDKMQSFYVDFEAKPTESVRGTVSFNILGNVAENPIDEIFYENRGRAKTIKTDDGNINLNSLNRVDAYKANISWNNRYFELAGFYRTGHYHWGYEGDFFGLYPEANYGPNIDIYNGTAPVGFEVAGKRMLHGFKVAFGPELWWGANPALLVKYGRKIGHFDVTGIFHEDIDKQGTAQSSFAIPAPPTRRATVHVETEFKGVGIEVGGIWAGQPRVGETFQIVDGEPGNYTVYQDKIKSDDTWGGKIKLTCSYGPVNWYAQGAAMGLVAGGGADLTQTFTGWRLKDSGSGNQFNALTGFTYTIG
ncbi:MAG: glycosidase, partial [bacterium]|nr:glycosidase [bacterium]